jgi:ArsR family transcriptional regulator, nickel/cobalt-responsive transcriptional repressor
MLKALSEPIRLRIVDVLRAGPKNVSEIAEAVGIEIVNASHHLGILKHAGIARSRREGRNIVYRLAEGVLDAKAGRQSNEHINLGCCRLEIPRE